MKKFLALILMLFWMLCCCTACDMLNGIFGKRSGVNKKYYENCAVFTFDDFESKISVTLDRKVVGEGAIYYHVDLKEGALGVKYADTGIFKDAQLLSEFTADSKMPISGFGGYIEGDKITITLEAFASVSGEIIIAFDEGALKAVHKDKILHEHKVEWETTEQSHKRIYTCNCENLINGNFEPHYDDENNGYCDECEYYVGIAHEDHNWYYEVNEDSHMQVFGCGCVSEGFEPHYNNDEDDLCDACGFNMFGHVHTWEPYIDEIGHGWSYTCGCCTPPNFTQHFDGDDDGECDDCKYTMNELPE